MSTGWNRASSAKVATSNSKRLRIPLAFFVVGLVLVVAVAVGLIVVFLNDGSQVEKREVTKTTRIKEVKPAAAATNAEEKAEKKIPFWKLDASQTNGFNQAMMRKWEIEHRPRRPVPKHEPAQKPKYWIFEHKSENLIAEMLCAKPGSSFIGRPNYRGINEDFIKSCQELILVSKDDDEYVANLKRQMIEVKKDLKPRIDAGEDLGKILDDTRDEFRKLAEYKRMLEKELREKTKDPDASAEDIEDLQQAVNVMLEKKGIAPVKFSPIAQMRINEMKKGKGK